MASRLNKFLVLALLAFSISGFKLKDEGVQVNPNPQEVNIVGGGIAATGGGVTSTITLAPAFSDISGSAKIGRAHV